MKIDHITAIVADGTAAARSLVKLFGVAPIGSVSLPGMDITTFQLGEAELHVNAPTAPGKVRDYLEAHGPGLHHLAVEVGDMDATLATLAARGFEVLGAPVETAPGLREVFVDPRLTAGILVQLVERKGQVRPGDLEPDLVGALAESSERDNPPDFPERHG